MKLGKIKTLLIVLFVGVISIFGLVGCGSSRDGMNIEIESEDITVAEDGTLSTSLSVERDLSGDLTPAGIAHLSVTVSGGDGSVNRGVRVVSSDTSRVIASTTFDSGTNTVEIRAQGRTSSATSSFVDIISLENNKLSKRIFVEVLEVASSLSVKPDLTSTIAIFMRQDFVLDPYTFFDFTPSNSAAPTMKFKINDVEYNAGEVYKQTAVATSLTIQAFSENDPENTELQAEFVLTVYPEIQNEIAGLKRTDSASVDANAKIEKLILFKNQESTNANLAEVQFYAGLPSETLSLLQYNYSFVNPAQNKTLKIEKTTADLFEITGLAESVDGVLVNFQVSFAGFQNSPIVTRTLLVKVVDLPRAVLINNESGTSDVTVTVLNYYTGSQSGAALQIDLWQFSEGYDEYELQVKEIVAEGYNTNLANNLTITDQSGINYSLKSVSGAFPILTFKSGDRLTLTGANDGGNLLVQVTAKANSAMKTAQNKNLATLTRNLVLEFRPGVTGFSVGSEQLESSTNSVYLQVGEGTVINNSQEVLFTVEPSGASMTNIWVDQSSLNAAVASVDDSNIVEGKITIRAHSAGTTSVRLVSPSGAVIVIPITVGYQVGTITTSAMVSDQVVAQLKDDAMDSNRKTLASVTLPTNNIGSISHNIFPAGATLLSATSTSTNESIAKLRVNSTNIKASTLYSYNAGVAEVTLKFRYNYLDTSGASPVLIEREITQTFTVTVYKPISSIELSQESMEFYVPVGTQKGSVYDESNRQKTVDLTVRAVGGSSTTKATAAKWEIIKGSEYIEFLDAEGETIENPTGASVIIKARQFYPSTSNEGSATVRVTIEDYGRTFTKDISIKILQINQVTNITLGGYSESDPIYFDISKGEYTEGDTLAQVKDFAKELNISVSANSGAPTNPKVEYIIFNADANFNAAIKVDQDKNTSDSVKLLKDASTGKYYLAPIKAGYSVLYIVPQDAMTTFAEDIKDPDIISSLNVVKRVEIYVADGVTVYYKIYTAADVAAMAKPASLDKNFYLMNTIDMNNYLVKNTWTPIGSDDAPFTGKLVSYGMDTDSPEPGIKAQTLFGWNIDKEINGASYGIFGNIGKGGQILNVNFEISSFQIKNNALSENYNGLLVGTLQGSLNNVSLTAKGVKVLAEQQGSSMYFGTVGRLTSTGTMAGVNTILDVEVAESSKSIILKFGGLVGKLEGNLAGASNTVVLNMVVENSNINSATSLLGGAVAYSTGSIGNVDTSGEIRTTGAYAVGGIVAHSTGGVANSTSSMQLGNGQYVGGIVGRAENGGANTGKLFNALGAETDFNGEADGKGYSISGNIVTVSAGDYAGNYTLSYNKVSIGGVECTYIPQGYITNSSYHAFERTEGSSIYTNVANSHIGGIAGYLENFNIEKSYVISYSESAVADILSTGTESSTVGGLVGKLQGSGSNILTLSTSFVDAKIEFNSTESTLSGINVGGLLGNVWASGSASLAIDNCFTNGVLVSESGTYTGLFIGSVGADTTITTSYVAQIRSAAFALFGTGTAPVVLTNVVVLGQFESETTGFAILEEMQNQSTFVGFNFIDIWSMPSEATNNSMPILRGVYPDIPTSLSLNAKTRTDGVGTVGAIQNTKSTKNLLVLLDSVDRVYNLSDLYDFGATPDGIIAANLRVQITSSNQNVVEIIQGATLGTSQIRFKGTGVAIITITCLQNSAAFDKLQINIINGFDEWLLYQSQDYSSPSTTYYVTIDGAAEAKQIGTDNKVTIDGTAYTYDPSTGKLTDSSGAEPDFNGEDDGKGYIITSDTQDNSIRESVKVGEDDYIVTSKNRVTIDGVIYTYDPSTGKLYTEPDFNGDISGNGYSISGNTVTVSAGGYTGEYTLSDNKVEIGGVEYTCLSGRLYVEPVFDDGYTLQQTQLSMQIDSVAQWFTEFFMDNNSTEFSSGGLMFTLDQSGKISIGSDKSMSVKDLAILTIKAAFRVESGDIDWSEIEYLKNNNAGNFATNLSTLNTIFNKFISGYTVTYESGKFTFTKDSNRIIVGENFYDGTNASTTLSRKSIVEMCVATFYSTIPTDDSNLNLIESTFQKFYPEGSVIWNGNYFEFSVGMYRFADCGLEYIREYIYISGSNFTEVLARAKTTTPINITITPYFISAFYNDYTTTGSLEEELIMLWQRQLSFSLSVYIGATSISTDAAGTEEEPNSLESGTDLVFSVTLYTDSPDDHANGISVIIERQKQDGTFEQVVSTGYEKEGDTTVREINYAGLFAEQYILTEDDYQYAEGSVYQQFRFGLTTLYKTQITQNELFRITVQSFTREGNEAIIKKIFLQFIPQTVTWTEIVHFADAELMVNTDRPGSYLKNAGESPGNTLIAGELGLLRIRIAPEFSHYDSITVTSSVANNDRITFDQRVAQTSVEFGNTVTKYMQYAQTVVNSDGSITLARVSNDDGGSYTVNSSNKVTINSIEYTYNPSTGKISYSGTEPDFNGEEAGSGYSVSIIDEVTVVTIYKYSFDGTFWLRTLTASTSTSVASFTVTITIKRAGYSDYVQTKVITVDSSAYISLDYPTKDDGVGFVAVGTGGTSLAEVNRNKLNVGVVGEFSQITVTVAGKDGFNTTGKVSVIESAGQYYLTVANDYNQNSGKYTVDSGNKTTIGGVEYLLSYNSQTKTYQIKNNDIEPDFNGDIDGKGYRVVVDGSTIYVQVGIVGEKCTVTAQGVLFVNGYRRTITRTMDFQIVDFVLKSGQAFVVSGAENGVLNYSYYDGAAYDLKIDFNENLVSYNSANSTVQAALTNLLKLMNGTTSNILVCDNIVTVTAGGSVYTYTISSGNKVSISGTEYTYNPSTGKLVNLSGGEPDFNGDIEGTGYTISAGTVTEKQNYNYNPWGYLTTDEEGRENLNSWEGQTYNSYAEETRPTSAPDNLDYYLQHTGKNSTEPNIFPDGNLFQVCPLKRATDQSLVLKGLNFGFDASGKLYIYPDGSGLVTSEIKLIMNFTQRTSLEHPIPINDKDEFKDMEAGKHYILLADLTLENWVPLATQIASLDGNGYTINIKSMQNNLADNQSAPANYGLFSLVTANMIVKNVTVNYVNAGADFNLNLSASSYVNFGGIAGTNQGIITNCVVQSMMKVDGNPPTVSVKQLIITSTNATANNFYIGGLVGINEGNITNSRVQESNLVARGLLGGLVSKNTGHISSSFVDGGTISNMGGEGSNGFTGGLVAENSGTITSSYVGGVTDAQGDGALVIVTVGTTTYKVNSNNKVSIGGVEYHYLSDKLYAEADFDSDTTGKGYSISGTTVTVNTGSYTGEYTLSDNKVEIGGVEYVFNDKNLYFEQDLNGEASGKGYSISAALTSSRTQSIVSGVVIGGFVSRNSGSISDCYSSVYIGVDTAASGAGGFVYENLVGGKISRCYSTSWLKESLLHTPFVGTTESTQSTELNNAGTIASCVFFDVGFGETSVGLTNDLGIYALTQAQFFNVGEESRDMWLDFALSRTREGDEVTEYDGVWAFVNEANDYFTPARFANSFGPRLVSADVIATPKLVLYSSEYNHATMDTVYTYSSVVGTTIDIANEKLAVSPYLIATAADLVKCVEEDYRSDEKANSWYRLVCDIDLSTLIGTSTSLNTMDKIFMGNLDGNGFTISNLDIASDGKKDNFGIFAKLQNASVKNLTIEVDDLSASQTVCVGVLAGTIDSSALSNVEVKAVSSTIVTGGNLVGGVAGKITGTSRLINISSNISTTAAYGTAQTIKALYNADFAKFYNGLNNKINADSILCYAGGIAGVIDLTGYKHEYNVPSFFNFNEAGAFNLMVEGTSKAIANTAGGIFGLVGSSTLVDTAVRKISSGGYIKADLFAGGVIGENHGLVNAAQFVYNDIVQNAMNSATVVGSLITDDNFSAFQGSSRGMGGLIGLNIGLSEENVQTGVIQNSSSRVRVANENAKNAGGLIGISVGGKVQHSYTSSSVRGSNSASVGGAIGYVTSDFENIDAFVINPLLNSENKSVVDKTELYLTLKGVVAYNNWYYGDFNYLKTLQEQSYSALGGLIGTLHSSDSLKFSHSTMSDSEYIEKRDSNLLYLSSETNFFVNYAYERQLPIVNASNQSEALKIISVGAFLNSDQAKDNGGTVDIATGQTRAQLKAEGKSRVFKNWPKFSYQKFDVANLPIYEHARLGDTIEIFSYEDILNTMQYWLDKNYILRADIDCGGRYPEIGSGSDPFTGTLTGENGDKIHTIYNIGSPTKAESVSGFFLETNGAQLTNFKMSGINLSVYYEHRDGESSYAGLLVGYAADTMIHGVSIVGNTTGEPDFNGEDAGNGYIINSDSTTVTVGEVDYTVGGNNKVVIDGVEYTYNSETGKLTAGVTEYPIVNNKVTINGVEYLYSSADNNKKFTLKGVDYQIGRFTNCVLIEGIAYIFDGTKNTLTPIGNTLSSNASHIGALAGKLETKYLATSIQDTMVEATVTALGWNDSEQNPTDRYVGGLVGRALGKTDSNVGYINEITTSFFEGNITVQASTDDAPLYLGGFVGKMENFELTNTFASTNIVIKNMQSALYAGGFAGDMSGSTLSGASAYGEMDVLMSAVSKDFNISGFAGTMSGCTLKGATTNLNIIFNTVSENWTDNANTQQGSEFKNELQRMAGFAGKIADSNLSDIVSTATIFNYTLFERVDMFVYDSSSITIANVYADNYLSLVSRKSLSSVLTGRTWGLLGLSGGVSFSDSTMQKVQGYYPYPALQGTDAIPSGYTNKQSELTQSAVGTKNHPQQINSIGGIPDGNSVESTYTWYVQKTTEISVDGKSSKELLGFYNGAGYKIKISALDSLVGKDYSNLGIFKDVKNSDKFGSAISGVNSPDVRIGLVSAQSTQSGSLSIGVIAAGVVEQKSVIYGCNVGGFIEVMSTNNNSSNYIGGIAAHNLGRIAACGSNLDIKIANSTSSSNAGFAVGGLVGVDAHSSTNQPISTKIYAYNNCYFSGSINNYIESTTKTFVGGLVGASANSAIPTLSNFSASSFAMYNMYTAVTEEGEVDSLVGKAIDHNKTSNVYYQNSKTQAENWGVNKYQLFTECLRGTGNPLDNIFSPGVWGYSHKFNYGLPYLNTLRNGETDNSCLKSTGDGADTPYLIRNAEQLVWALSGNSTYKLETDIDYSKLAGKVSGLSFAGTLDGANHYITGSTGALMDTLSGTVKNLGFKGIGASGKTLLANTVTGAVSTIFVDNSQNTNALVGVNSGTMTDILTTGAKGINSGSAITRFRQSNDFTTYQSAVANGLGFDFQRVWILTEQDAGLKLKLRAFVESWSDIDVFNNYLAATQGDGEPLTISGIDSAEQYAKVLQYVKRTNYTSALELQLESGATLDFQNRKLDTLSASINSPAENKGTFKNIVLENGNSVFNVTSNITVKNLDLENINFASTDGGAIVSNTNAGTIELVSVEKVFAWSSGADFGVISKVNKGTLASVTVDNAILENKNATNVGALTATNGNGSDSGTINGNNEVKNIQINQNQNIGNQVVGGAIGLHNKGSVTGITVSDVNLASTGTVGGVIGIVAQGSSINGLLTASGALNLDAAGDIGGFIGQNNGTIGGKMTAGTLEKLLTITTAETADSNNVGGFVGSNLGTGTSGINATTFNANMVLNVTADTSTNIGGAIGSSTRGVKLAVSGDITVNAEEVSGFGGIIGTADNSATVDITSSANITVNATGKATNLGGFIGEFKNIALAAAPFTRTDGDITINAATNGSECVGGMFGTLSAAQFSLANYDYDGTIAVTTGVATNVGGVIGNNNSMQNTETEAVTINNITLAVGSGSSNVGGLAGYNSGNVLKNIQLNTVSITATAGALTYFGGAVGYNASGTLSSIEVSEVTGQNLTNSSYVGGLVGYNNGAIVGGSVSSISLTANQFVGGVVGLNNIDGTIKGTANVDLTASKVSLGGNSETGVIVGSNLGAVQYISLDNNADNKSSVTYNTSEGSPTSAGFMVGLNSGTIDNMKLDLEAASNITFTAGGATQNIGLITGINSGTITNTTLENVSQSFASKSNAGLAVGHNTETGEMENVAITTGTLTLSGSCSNMGGLVGLNEGTLTDSSVTDITVTTEGTATNIGGIAGKSTAGISGVSAEGVVVTSANGTNVGGLVGLNEGVLADSSADTVTVTIGTEETASSGTNVGGLVGLNTETGEMENVAITTGTLTLSGSCASVGGLVGLNEGTLTDSSVTDITVTTEGTATNIGGIAGKSTAGISGVSAEGVVVTSANGTNVGGLVGLSSASVEGSVQSLTITGYKNVGGLVGEITNLGSVINSTISGSGNLVSGFENVGGIAGLNSGTVKYFTINADMTVEGTGLVGGLVGENTGTVGGGAVGTLTVQGVSAPNTYTDTYVIGGLVGLNNGNIAAEDLDSEGTDLGKIEVTKLIVSGGMLVGGLVGMNGESGTVNFVNISSEGEPKAYTIGEEDEDGEYDDKLVTIDNKVYTYDSGYTKKLYSEAILIYTPIRDEEYEIIGFNVDGGEYYLDPETNNVTIGDTAYHYIPDTEKLYNNVTFAYTITDNKVYIDGADYISIKMYTSTLVDVNEHAYLSAGKAWTTGDGVTTDTEILYSGFGRLVGFTQSSLSDAPLHKLKTANTVGAAPKLYCGTTSEDDNKQILDAIGNQP